MKTPLPAPHAPHDFAPLVRWLHSEATNDESLRRALRTLHAMGFSGIIATPREAASIKVLLNDEGAPLSLWRTSDTVQGATRPALWYRTEEHSAADAAQWSWPHDDPLLIAVVAVPLRGTNGAPDWSRVITLTPHSFTDAQENLLAGIEDNLRFHFWRREDIASQSVNLLDATGLHALLASTRTAFQNDIVQPGEAVSDAANALHLSIEGNRSGGESHGLPWSAQLPAAFRARHGYALEARLASLTANTGADAAKVRQDFWTSVTQLGLQNLRDVLSTSETPHTLSLCAATADEPPSAVTGRCGDVVPLWRESAIPAVSIESLNIDNAVMARLCASIAALDGKERALAELWRACDWSATPSARLPALHRLMQCGLNTFVSGAACASLTHRILEDEFSHAAGSEVHQPFGEQGQHFNDYTKRCCHELSYGRNGARVGVLWPARSVWAHYNPNGHRFVRWVEEDLRNTLQLLDELHFDFVLLPEDDLCAAPMEAESQTSTRLLCGRARLPLEMIVLPSVTALSHEAWQKIQTFVEAGGKVACLGLLPRWSERGRDTQLEEDISRETRLGVGDLYTAYTARENDQAESDYVAYPLSREYHSGGRLCCYQPRLEINPDNVRLYVRRILSESIQPELETQSPSIVYTRRVHNDGELFFLFNRSEESQRVNVRLRCGRDCVPHLRNAWTGASTPIAEWTRFTEEEGGGVSVTLAFAPQEAHMVWLEYVASSLPEPRIERANFIAESFDGSTVRGYTTENTAPAFAARNIAGKMTWRYGDEAAVPAPLLLDEWSAQRLHPNLWLLPARRGPRGDIIEFEMVETPSSFFLCVKKSSVSAAPTLNGVPLMECPAPFSASNLWLDEQWRWFDLAAAHIGTNEIAVPVLREDIVLRLVGDFHLQQVVPDFWNTEATTTPAYTLAATQPLVLSDGSWHEQGLPFYCGAIEYSQRLNIPAEWQNCRVFIEVSLARDVVESRVNGAACGVRLAPPYRFDVTGAIRADDVENTITITVWNSAQAALQPDVEAAPSGLLGPVRLVAYPRVEIGSEA